MNNDGRIYALTLFFYASDGLTFTAEYTRAKLERAGDWLSLDEIDWIRMAEERVYRGSIFFKTRVEYERDDDEDDKPWIASDSDEVLERDATYLFRWKDIEGIRLIYLNETE